MACGTVNSTSWLGFFHRVLGTAAQQGTVNPDHNTKDTKNEADPGENSAHDLRSHLLDPHTTCWSEDTSQEVPGEAISSCRRSGVESVCRHHVVDCGCIDGVVRNPDEENADTCTDPCIVTIERVGSSCKECEAECEAPRGVAEDLQAAFILRVLAVRLSGALLCVSSVEQTDNY